MAITIQGPDGASIDFPEGTSEAEMSAAMAQAYPHPSDAAQAPSGPGVMAGVSRALESNLPFVDRAVAAAKSSLPQGYGGTGQDYASNLAAEKSKNAQFAEQNPWTNAVGGLAAYAPAALLPGGSGLASRIGTGALTGFGLGGVQGASNSPDLTNTQETGKSIAEGELTGGALGGAFPAGASAIGSAFSRGAIDPARQALVQSLQNVGIKPTAGQITGNQGLQKLEASLSDIPLGGGGAEKFRQANSAAFTKAILSKAGFPEVADASPESLNAAHEALGAQFDALGSRNAILPDQQFTADMTKAVNDYHNVTGTPAPGVSKFVEGIKGTPPSSASNAAVAPPVQPGTKEPSLTSAIRYNGKLYRAPDNGTHLDALSNVPPDAREGATLDANSRVFVTENGRVLDRSRAQDYAVKHDLFASNAPAWARTAPELIDEVLARGEPSRPQVPPGPAPTLDNGPGIESETPVATAPPAPRVILGEEYNNLRSQLGKTAQNLRFTDPAQAESYRGVQDALDSAMERSIAANNPGDLGAFQAVRQKYKNLLPIEQAAGSAGADAASGIISPQQMRTALTAGGNRRSYARGIGDLAPLTNAGNAILTNFPQSGTAPRTMMAHALQGIGAVAGGLGGATGGIEGAGLGATAGAIGLPMLAGNAIMSKPGQAILTSMLAKRLPVTPNASRPVSRAAITAALAANAQRNQTTQP